MNMAQMRQSRPDFDPDCLTSAIHPHGRRAIPGDAWYTPGVGRRRNGGGKREAETNGLGRARSGWRGVNTGTHRPRAIAILHQLEGGVVVAEEAHPLEGHVHFEVRAQLQQDAISENAGRDWLICAIF